MVPGARREKRATETRSLERHGPWRGREHRCSRTQGEVIDLRGCFCKKWLSGLKYEVSHRKMVRVDLRFNAKIFFRFSSKNQLFRVISRRKIECCSLYHTKNFKRKSLKLIDICHFEQIYVKIAQKCIFSQLQGPFLCKFRSLRPKFFAYS
jgi:hypothetical protein